MEIILVDDGSQDGSSAIAQKMAAENPIFTYIRQENAGLSAARNTGIRHSKGEYITFVDSDDFLLEDAYSPLLQLLDERKDCDILEFSLVKNHLGEETECLLADATYTDARSYWLKGQAYAHTYAWNKLFRRDLLFPESGGERLFREGIVFEDAEFLGRLLQSNPCVVTTSLMGYSYQWNPQGITSTADGQKLASLLDTNIRVARQLGLAFMQQKTKRPFVNREEALFYQYLLNMQISVCQQTGNNPVLPDCKLHLCSAKGRTMKLKALLLYVFGLKGLLSILRK